MTHNPFKAPPGFNPLLFRFLLWKRYFDTGLSLTNYLKYIIAFFGLASRDLGTTMWLAVGYAVFCQALGCAWHHLNLVRLEIEIGNRFNDFVKEMRDKINNNQHA